MEDETTDMMEPAEEEESEVGVCECLLTHDQDIFFPIDGEPYIAFTLDGEEYEYPPNYGAGICAAWDSGLEPSCADDGADFCGDSWCYVADDCEASDVTASTYFEGLSYSYRTCPEVEAESTEEESTMETEAADEAEPETATEETAEDETASADEPVDETGVCECLITND